MTHFKADLHCHTTCSDGTFSPEELIIHAKERGLSGLSITDHDTVDAYPAATKNATDHEIELISGIEFSTGLYGESVHILGYAFDWQHPAIKTLCEKHRLRRNNRNTEILHLLKKEGLPISEEELRAVCQKDQNIVGRPHIALAMMNLGYVSSVPEAFNKYLSERGSCFVRGAGITLEETMSTIREAKGLVVIAHPHLVKDAYVLRSLLNMDFDGIECYYGRFPPAKEERWLKTAKRKEWLITGGSDFHGSVKPNLALGCSWASEETFQILKTHYIKAISK